MTGFGGMYLQEGWVELSAPPLTYLPYVKVSHESWGERDRTCVGSSLLGTGSLSPLSSLLPYLASFLLLHHGYFL